MNRQLQRAKDLAEAGKRRELPIAIEFIHDGVVPSDFGVEEIRIGLDVEFIDGKMVFFMLSTVTESTYKVLIFTRVNFSAGQNGKKRNSAFFNSHVFCGSGVFEDMTKLNTSHGFPPFRTCDAAYMTQAGGLKKFQEIMKIPDCKCDDWHWNIAKFKRADKAEVAKYLVVDVLLSIFTNEMILFDFKHPPTNKMIESAARSLAGNKFYQKYCDVLVVASSSNTSHAPSAKSALDEVPIPIEHCSVGSSSKDSTIHDTCAAAQPIDDSTAFELFSGINDTWESFEKFMTMLPHEVVISHERGYGAPSSEIVKELALQRIHLFDDSGKLRLDRDGKVVIFDLKFGGDPKAFFENRGVPMMRKVMTGSPFAD